LSTESAGFTHQPTNQRSVCVLGGCGPSPAGANDARAFEAFAAKRPGRHRAHPALAPAPFWPWVQACRLIRPCSLSGPRPSARFAKPQAAREALAALPKSGLLQALTEMPSGSMIRGVVEACCVLLNAFTEQAAMTFGHTDGHEGPAAAQFFAARGRPRSCDPSQRIEPAGPV